MIFGSLKLLALKIKSNVFVGVIWMNTKRWLPFNNDVRCVIGACVKL